MRQQCVRDFLGNVLIEVVLPDICNYQLKHTPPLCRIQSRVAGHCLGQRASDMPTIVASGMRDQGGESAQ